MSFYINKKTVNIFFFLTCLLVLFVSFRMNFFHVAESNWFNNNQLDSESLVLGKILDARENGIMRSYGLGWYSDEKDLRMAWLDYRNTYLNNKSANKKLNPYTSQVGLQGFVFSTFDKIIPVTEKFKLHFFYDLNSFLLALILTLIVTWLTKEFNVFIGIVLLISTIFSPWLTIFGKNLYWVSWTWFLPMLVSILILEYADYKKNFPMIFAFISTAVAVMIKSMCGYEFISTILIAMMIPYIYYAISRRWLKRDLFVRFGLISIAGLLGFIIAIIIHAIMLYSLFSDLNMVFQTLKLTIIRRTFADPTLLNISDFNKESLVAPVTTVLDRYFYGGLQYDWVMNKGYFIDLSSLFYVSNNFLKISYQEIIFVFMFFSSLSLVSENYIPSVKKWRNQFIALVISTWFSILAPLSWFILAKAHSYIHVHINYVLWHVPFCIFGFAIVGVMVNCILESVNIKTKVIIIATSLMFFVSIVISQNQWLFGKTMPANLSDANWKNGISISGNSVLFKDTYTNHKLIEASKSILFLGNDKRNIVKIEMEPSQWILVYYEDEKVDSIKGYPCFVEFDK
ncbi:hypothetical protein Psfp_01600 [Pelotomaculum sp. FP]|uniref:hypothetical protein n=1 Tax=Pelotomaculum sp. FP TaxID=261474 RepID=UPI0010658932|nr:hypothetical protein [Pelotomaculum sp. FP]TEB16172.1 hypothetical protein Psfp_01600 [Pelotomaculum sp. FP]